MSKRYTYDPEFEFSNPGNGKAVPQFTLDENGKAVPMLDENGKQVVHSLYDDIQLNAKTNDYKKILEQGGDVTLFAGTARDDVDYTEFGTGSDLLNTSAMLRDKGISTDDFLKFAKEFISKYENNSNMSINSFTGDKSIHEINNQENKENKGENK